jgi:hypothetical protein
MTAIGYGCSMNRPGASLSRCFAITLALGLGVTFGCDVKRSAGEKCETTANCETGLVCAAQLCADGAHITKKRAERIQELVQTYMHDHKGKCPSSISAVTPGSPIVDAWDQPFTMACPGERFVVDVVSLGPDGHAGTEDDVWNVDEGIMGGAAPGE